MKYPLYVGTIISQNGACFHLAIFRMSLFGVAQGGRGKNILHSPKIRYIYSTMMELDTIWPFADIIIFHHK